MTKKYIDQLSYKIIGCAIEVHKELGPGLLESIYEKCLVKELKDAGLRCESQRKVPVIYKNEELEAELRFDVLVEDLIVVELKTVENLLPVHEAQLMTYMRLLEKPKGILINFFSSNIFHEGQKTMVNEFYRKLL